MENRRKPGALHNVMFASDYHPARSVAGEPRHHFKRMHGTLAFGLESQSSVWTSLAPRLLMKEQGIRLTGREEGASKQLRVCHQGHTVQGLSHSA